MKQLLVIGYVWPEPNSSAAGRNMLTLLQFFQQQNYQITFASPAAESPHRFQFEEWGIAKAEIELNNESFDHFVSALNPDVVLFDRFMMEEQFGWRVSKHCPNAIKILDLEDLCSLRNARQLALKQNRPLNDSDYKSELALREIAAIWRCDLALVISSFEMELLQTKYSLPAEKLFHLPFLLDEVPEPASWQTYDDRVHFVTIGNFRHEPNWDAVLYLQQKIWPLIRAKLKHAEMHIYGAYVPKKATQLNNPKQGFLVKGWAGDAEAVVSSARVCLAPLRFGAGLKGKLFEAMLVGTPSVTTPIGAEAMHADLTWPGAIAQTDAEFAEAAINLYQDKSAWQQAQQQGKTLLETLYLAEPHINSLKQSIKLIEENLEDFRNRNIIGAMLQHHTMKSTQYMAQWIEAKNKNT